MKTWAMLVRREFWEHRGLWIAPAIIAIALIVPPLIGTGPVPAGGSRIAIQDALRSPDSGFYMTLALSIGFGVLVVSGSMVAGYLLDCLYAERKDRSILFWKSLPVSDRDTVLAKFATAMLIVPSYGYLLTVVTHLVCVTILLGPPFGYWSELLPTVLETDAKILARLPALVLWYAPLASWMLLASAMARRSPYLYALLPPVSLVVLERLAFGSNHLLSFIGERFAPGGFPGVSQGGPNFDLSSLPELERIDLWLGLVAAAAMIAIAIRLRRYRDDT